MTWPALRQEIDLFEGPTLSKGQPSWVLHDPVRHQFFRIDWLTFEILRRWTLNDAQAIIRSIEQDTPLEVTQEDLETTAKFLTENQLVSSTGDGAIHNMAERRQASRQRWWQWLIHHYLFFRLPLCRPDGWLGRTRGLTELFFSRSFIAVSLGALGFGLYQLSQQWDRFHSYILDTFTLQGLAAYCAALFVSKFLHELGHAYALKRHGGRVPTMGIAFLVLWPMAYTDTNEAWKVADRKKRLQISSAGIVTEALIAAWALLAWSLLPDGALRSAMFFLASVSLGLTLALNANPFMRFDGYFMLCDWLDMPNLHHRSFALARWQLRETLFKLGEPKPEQFSLWKHRCLVAFAWAVWIYRFFLFLGIALMVYFLFTKLLGIVLFIVEIYWFIVLPLRNECKEWLKRRRAIAKSARFRLCMVLAALTLGLFALPLPTRISVTALLRPGEIWPVHSPGAARIDVLRVQHGDRVVAGQTLVQMTAPDILLQNQIAESRLQHLRAQTAAATRAGDQGGLPLALLRTQAQAAEAEFVRSRQQLQQYSPEAPFAGRFVLHDPDLASGQWLEKNEKIGAVISLDSWRLETWVDEQRAARLHAGDKAWFFADGLSAPLRATVMEIAKDSTRSLSDGLLTAPHGGHVIVREQHGTWIPELANYRVGLSLDEPFVPRLQAIQRGELAIEGRPESLAGRYLQHALAVLIREFRP